MASTRPNNIPSFIAASKPRALRRSMLKTNAKYGMTINYFDIQFVDGKWYAWFYLPVTNETIKELSDGDAEQ